MFRMRLTYDGDWSVKTAHSVQIRHHRPVPPWCGERARRAGHADARDLLLNARKFLVEPECDTDIGEASLRNSGVDFTTFLDREKSKYFTGCLVDSHSIDR
jgi:hypothetical protein